MSIDTIGDVLQPLDPTLNRDAAKPIQKTAQLSEDLLATATVAERPLQMPSSREVREIVLNGTGHEREILRKEMDTVFPVTPEIFDLRSGLSPLVGNMLMGIENLTPDEQNRLLTEAKNFLRDGLKGFGLDVDTMFSAWRESCSPALLGHTVYKNLQQIHDLEKSRPGICRSLTYDMFTIRDFARLPLPLLTAQYDNRNNDNIRWGALFLPYSDNDPDNPKNAGAFYHTKDALGKLYSDLEKINEGLPDGEPKYGIRAFEVASNHDFTHAYTRADARYGAQHPIEFVILAGHGSWGDIQVGTDPTQSSSLLQKDDIVSILPYCVDNPNFVFISCHTGEGKGLAQQISLRGAKTLAPRRRPRTKEIDAINVSRDPNNGELNFNVAAGDSWESRVYDKGELIE